MTLLGELAVHEPQLRVVDTDGRRALAAVSGLTATTAVAKLRFGPGRTCEPIARLIEKAVSRAERGGIDGDRLIVVGGSVTTGEDIVRVRRKAHGKADWIASPTSDVRVELRPAGLHASAPELRIEVDHDRPDVGVGVDAGEDVASASSADPLVEDVRSALYEVIDPDLGVNVVDLGFVRGIAIDQDTAVITMTLTSPACPLAGVMEEQIRRQLVDERGVVTAFRVDWVWVPAWRPTDITEEGRWELGAIGFSF